MRRHRRAWPRLEYPPRRREDNRDHQDLGSQGGPGQDEGGGQGPPTGLQIRSFYGFDNVQVDLGVVRGLDYYTGMVRDGRPRPGRGEADAAAGPTLTELFGGEKTFSTGFGIADRTLLALSGGLSGTAPCHRRLRDTGHALYEGRRFLIVAQLRREGVATESTSWAGAFQELQARCFPERPQGH